MNQNSIQEEIKSRLRSGNTCYDSVQNLMSSNLLSKNVKIKVYRITVLYVVFLVAHTGEESSLRVLENRVLRVIVRPKRDQVIGEWRKLRTEELNYLYLSPN